MAEADDRLKQKALNCENVNSIQNREKQGCRLIAASNNPDKVVEIADILALSGFTVTSMVQEGIVSDPDETGDTLMSNALIKARALKRVTSAAVIADDSGLFVEALGGRPGVHSARYLSPNTAFTNGVERLLDEMGSVPAARRTAWFVAVAVLVTEDGVEFCARGFARGYIGSKPKGQKGFGFDPIFYDRRHRSFAQLTKEHKNAVSHRGRALRKLAFKRRGITRMRSGH